MTPISSQTKSSKTALLLENENEALSLGLDIDLNLYKPLPQQDWPATDHLTTEDDTPMDNIFSEKQQRLLTESLYASWKKSPDFVALANVALFYGLNYPPIVPDVLLSLNVQIPDDLWTKYNRSYMVWMYGKPPEIVIEIVSNKKGEETGEKLQQYAQIKVAYYVVYDPNHQLSKQSLQIYELRGNTYYKRKNHWFADLGLGLVEWRGPYENVESVWLRWCKEDKTPISTGTERAEKLAAQLQALGIKPEV